MPSILPVMNGMLCRQCLQCGLFLLLAICGWQRMLSLTTNDSSRSLTEYWPAGCGAVKWTRYT
eukprot:scaffold137413_cov33-Prasinocladus_malaysianus.AAC.2